MVYRVQRLFCALSLMALGAACAGAASTDFDSGWTEDERSVEDVWFEEVGADLESVDGPEADVVATDGATVPDMPVGWECAAADDCAAQGALEACEAYECTEEHLCAVATAADGSLCIPDDLCFDQGSCVTGACIGDVPTDCDDDNPCTLESCDAEAGCQSTAIEGSCDDGDKCTADDTCQAGNCSGTAIVCDDANPCTSDSCDPIAGCLFTNQDGDCDDEDPCTSAGTCVGGVCAGQETLCECHEDVDCAALLANPCILSASCDTDELPYVCDVVEVSCEPSDSVCATVACDADSGACVPVPANEGEACDEPTNCVSDGVCQDGICVGSVTECLDENPCTADICVPGEGCSFPASLAPCDDGDECTVNDFCTEAKVCLGAPTGCEALPVLGIKLTSLVFEQPGFCLPSLLPNGECTEATGLVNSFIKDDIESAESPFVMLGLFDPFDLAGSDSTFALGPGTCSLDADGNPTLCSFDNAAAQLAPVTYAQTGECATATQSAPAPCFEVAGDGIEVGVMGIIIPINQAQVTGSFIDMPAPSQVTDGHIEAFLLKSVADAISVTLPLMPPYKLSELLHPDGLIEVDGLQGWPLLVHFTAIAVPTESGE